MSKDAREELEVGYNNSRRPSFFTTTEQDFYTLESLDRDEDIDDDEDDDDDDDYDDEEDDDDTDYSDDDDDA